MGIIVLLIAISVAIAILFLSIFFWNIKSGQYDDTYTPSVRMLFEDKPKVQNQFEEVSCALQDVLTKSDYRIGSHSPDIEVQKKKPIEITLNK
jgi:cbb3-type cytochrome oxidase maturation protein